MVRGIEAERHMTKQMVSHERQEEAMEAKARWFQSLPLEERMALLCEFTDLILAVNPDIVERMDLIASKRAAGREKDLTDVRLLELDD